MDLRTLQMLEESPIKFPICGLVRCTGASENMIEALLSFAGTRLPADYLDFLRYSNGFSDDLWDIETILKDGYQVRTFMPGAIAIGNNGGPDVFVIDTRSFDSTGMVFLQCNVCALGWDEFAVRVRVAQWRTFHELFAHLYQGWEESQAETDEELAEDAEWYGEG